MFPIYLLLAGGIALTIGDLIAGKYIKSKTKLLYLSVMVFYIIGLTFLIFSYKFENIAVASITLEIFNILTLTIAGKFLFKENITKTELCGIIVGLIAVIIL
ncbi:MAG: hypothetical protein WC711_02595 [Candidatus Staskawiczbacteria bacterium]|jgi:multidrug transporter EmrE-like cation transporter